MIVPVDPRSADEVGEFMREVVLHSVDATDAEKQAYLANMRANLAAWQQRPETALHLQYLRDDGLAGVVMVKAWWNLCHLFVGVESQRRGIGRALVEAAVVHCSERSARDRLQLNAARNAAPFYEHLGFVRVADAPASAAGIAYELLLHPLRPLR